MEKHQVPHRSARFLQLPQGQPAGDKVEPMQITSGSPRNQKRSFEPENYDECHSGKFLGKWVRPVFTSIYDIRSQINRLKDGLEGVKNYHRRMDVVDGLAPRLAPLRIMRNPFEAVKAKQAPNKHSDDTLQIATVASYVARHSNITVEPRRLLKRLLEAPQTTPEASLFSDDFFDETCEMRRGQHENRVLRDIGQFIVPSAELLATCGALHDRFLTETVNEGWTNSDQFDGSGPAPHFAVGFNHEAFTPAQRHKIHPEMDPMSAHSPFTATHRVCFPFLVSQVTTSSLEAADDQNTHSINVALSCVARLFQLAQRETELHGDILAFSISHD